MSNDNNENIDNNNINENSDNNTNEKKVKISEKLSHGFRKRWLYSGTKLILLVAILFVAYYCLYLYLDKHDLPEFDVTKYKLHTLSDSSKKVLEGIDQDIEILAYGYPEKYDIFKLFEQYNRANSHITYRTISEETDLALINSYGLKSGYVAVIIKAGDNEKIIDNSEFTQSNFTEGGQNIDVTEEVITNSILSLIEKNKPNVYFTMGHQEFTDSQLAIIKYLLRNESFLVGSVNIDLDEKIPDDCDVLAVCGLREDFSEKEYNIIKEYIENGGNLFIAFGVLEDGTDITNVQKILDEYGVTYENGYILEYAANMSNENAPIAFMPSPSIDSTITADFALYNHPLVLDESARLKFNDNMDSLNVKGEVLLYSSDESVFIDDLRAELENSALTPSSTGKSTIAALLTKQVGETDSKLVLCATSGFMSNTISAYVSSSTDLVYHGANKDFVINSMAYLGEKDYTLSIRKNYTNSFISMDDKQNTIVLTIAFSVPLFIIIAGFIIWHFRKKKK